MEYLVIFACIIFLFVLFRSIVDDKQKDAEIFWETILKAVFRCDKRWIVIEPINN